MADQFFMTQKGYDEAVERLKYLQTVKRQEIIERIAEARSHGDLSENAEYDAARNEQSANEGEIVELDYKIKNAKIIEENDDTSFAEKRRRTRSPARRSPTRWKTKFPTSPPSARRCSNTGWGTW